MARLFQVGVGSGGMPVLDAVCRDPRITGVTLVEPDVYQAHNVERHLFPSSAVGSLKVDLAADWLRQRRPEMALDVFPWDLLDPTRQSELEMALQQCDLGICAADNELAKFHFDRMMRQARKPWTLGEVLSGGIGGFVHWFVPDGPCYGCVASHFQRPGPDAVRVEASHTPDYSQPGGAVHEVRIPASKASIQAIASLHALITLDLLAPSESPYDPGFTSLLMTLQRVPGVFEDAFRPYRFRVVRTPECLICRSESGDTRSPTPEELDVALDAALARLDHE